MTTAAIRLLLVRHGATAWNDEHRIIGRTDLPLSPAGREQAHLVAARLALETIHALHASPLQRAIVTAAGVSEACGLPYLVDERLRETDLGAWEGLTLDEAAARYGADLAAWKVDPTAAPTDGESPAHLVARVRSFLGDLCAHHAGQTVALVGHGGIFQALLFIALDIPYRNDWLFYLYNGSLSELWLRPERNVAVYLNDTGHLRRAPDTESARPDLTSARSTLSQGRSGRANDSRC
jgi:broad specificity phosphatase PhoE